MPTIPLGLQIYVTLKTKADKIRIIDKINVIIGLLYHNRKISSSVFYVMAFVYLNSVIIMS